MPFCSGSPEARVWFRYPNQPWNNVISRRPAVDYSFEEFSAKGKCDGVRYEVTYSGLFWQGYNWNPAPCNPVWSTFKITVWGPIGGFTTARPMTVPNWQSCGGKVYYQDWFLECRGGFNIPVWYGPHQIHWSSDYSEMKIDSIVRVDGLPDTCGESGCRFKVTDQGGQIYSRTEAVCPEVRVQCADECPPGYCKCERYPGDPNWCCCKCCE